MNAMFDVIIVGAGPAGSTCANYLRKSGMNVKLFDKKVFPRVKPCAGWITPQVVSALQLDLVDYQKANTLQPITGFRTGILGRRMLETKYRDPVSFGIRRVEFDNYLLERSGVKCEHESIKQIEREGNRWRINQRYTAPLLIGAGGHFCPVADFVRQRSDDFNGYLSTAETPVVYAQEVEFEMSERQMDSALVHAQMPELYFCQDLKGYGWCFRKGNFLNLGLGRAEKSNLSKHLRQFCEFLKLQRQLIDDLPSRFLGHAYRLYAERSPALFNEGLLLVGDAAGLAYPQSGEGIRPAIESALIAAHVATEANNDYSKEVLSSYEVRITERFGKTKPLQAVSWMPVAWLQNIALTLMATHWFTRKTVIENWFLHRHEDAIPTM